MKPPYGGTGGAWVKTVLVGGVLVEGGGEWGPLLVMTIMTTRPISRRKGGGAEGVMLVD